MRDYIQTPEFLGTTLRDFRVKKGITLQELAAKTDLSSGFISRIERNINKPSIRALQRLCYGLDIAIDDLALPAGEKPAQTQENHMEAQVNPEEVNGRRLFVSCDKRSIVYNLNGVIKLEAIFTDSRNYKLEAMTLTGTEAEYVSSKHQYNEIGIVATGRLAITLNEETEYIMNEGDSLLIPAGTEHTIRKVSDEVCISYWFKVSSNGEFE